MLERAKLDGLTSARFYAALMIVLFHLAAMPKLGLPPYLQFIGGHFGLGVPLFFTISAFSMCVGYSGQLDGTVQVRDYAVRRFFRIAPLFYVMMAVYVAYRYLEYGVGTEWGYILTSATFTFNLTPQYVSGYVWASWSIGIEMMFYLLFPMIVQAVSTLPRSVAFFVLAAYLSAVWSAAFEGVTGVMAHFGNYFLAAHILYFAGGILAYFVWLRIRHRRDIGMAVLVIGIISFIATIAFRGDLQRIGGSGLMKVTQTLPLMLFTIGIAICPIRPLVNRFTKALGETSFSLYLFHPLIIGFLMNRGFYKWVTDVVPNLGLAYAASAVATLGVLFPLAFLGYRFIEMPGNRAGGLLIRRWRSPLPLGSVQPTADAEAASAGLSRRES